MRNYGGLGLGLHISKEIVQRHGGRMWVESVEGAGSRFLFSLPVDDRRRTTDDNAIRNYAIRNIEQIMPDYRDVGEKIDAIESELRRIGWWRDEPLPHEMYNFTQAFAMDTMPFQYWLQFIFIPRVRDIIASEGDFPRQSNVGVQAVREFDGLDEASELSSLLSDFDQYTEQQM